MRFLLLLVALFALLCPVFGGQITSLPGAPSVSFNQYSGYITVSPTNGRALFYYFVESQNNPATDPIVLWLNGGPGCSSLLGAFTENGPFYPQTDGATLKLNPHSWNKVANVIYLESPACVGFSYSNTTSDCTVGDKRTAADSVAFLQGFFKEFPQFAKSPLWITGESYGGHYVPNLTWLIWQEIQSGAVGFNLQGMAAGNPWTQATSDNSGAVQMAFSHAIISDEIYQGIMGSCDFSVIGPLSAAASSKLPSATNSSQCDYWLGQMDSLMTGVNIYDLYADVCLQGEEVGQGEQLMRHLVDIDPLSPHRAALSAIEKRRSVAQFARFAQPMTQYPDPDPCIQSHITSYLNLPAVQSAMHVTGPVTQWSGCSSTVNYSRSDLLTSMLPVYENLLTQTNLNLYVLSGDIDGICSIQGTKNWLASSGFTITDPWRSWTGSNQQTGGWTQAYKAGPSSSTSLRFVSVRDAGHMIPYTQPDRSLDVMTRIFSHQPI